MPAENIAISKALEVRLAEIAPAIETAWENDGYKPVTGVPYQQVNVLFAEPENPTMGDDFWRQRGFLQVQLRYPLNVGKLDAGLRAGLIRDHFKRGLSLVADGITTIVEKTPEISGGSPDDGRYVVNVRVRFFANIFPNGA